MATYESPFDDYPGTVTLPDAFNGGMYRTWTEHNKAADGDPADGVTRLAANWRALQALGQVEIDGLPASLDFDEMPVEVMSWAVGCFAQWLHPFVVRPRLLSVRGNSATGED